VALSFVHYADPVSPEDARRVDRRGGPSQHSDPVRRHCDSIAHSERRAPNLELLVVRWMWPALDLGIALAIPRQFRRWAIAYAMILTPLVLFATGSLAANAS
jgi:hypothetical protein